MENATLRAMLPWDGTNRVFFNKADFAALSQYSIEFLTPELGVFPASEEVLIANLQGVDAFFAGSEYVTRPILDQVPSLKLVQRIGVGYDKVDVAAATELGVLVAITPGILSGTVAEHTYALMLALAGRIPRYDREVKAGQWNPGIRDDLHGATLGIIGLGRIGKETARRAPAFHMRVMAYDVFRDEEFAREHDVTYASLEEVLTSADYISLSMSLTEETRGMIGKEALALMKPTAYLINVARGAVVDEEAVCEALAEGSLAGYATDHFIQIPPPVDHPLLQFDNVVVTPWVAAASKGTTRRLVRLAAECTGKILTGQPAPEGCILNPEILPVWRGRA